jgi:hypothetical protein
LRGRVRERRRGGPRAPRRVEPRLPSWCRLTPWRGLAARCRRRAAASGAPDRMRGTTVTTTACPCADGSHTPRWRWPRSGCVPSTLTACPLVSSTSVGCRGGTRELELYWSDQLKHSVSDSGVEADQTKPIVVRAQATQEIACRRVSCDQPPLARVPDHVDTGSECSSSPHEVPLPRRSSEPLGLGPISGCAQRKPFRTGGNQQSEQPALKRVRGVCPSCPALE